MSDLPLEVRLVYLGQVIEQVRAASVADVIRRPRGRSRRDHVALQYDPHAAFEVGEMIRRILFATQSGEEQPIGIAKAGASS